MSIPLKGAKRRLFSHFGNADTQLLGDLPAAVGLCEKSETWLLLGDWLSRDLKADKSLRGQGYFLWYGFWGTILLGPCGGVCQTITEDYFSTWTS